MPPFDRAFLLSPLSANQQMHYPEIRMVAQGGGWWAGGLAVRPQLADWGQGRWWGHGGGDSPFFSWPGGCWLSSAVKPNRSHLSVKWQQIITHIFLFSVALGYFWSMEDVLESRELQSYSPAEEWIFCQGRVSLAWSSQTWQEEPLS